MRGRVESGRKNMREKDREQGYGKMKQSLDIERERERGRREAISGRKIIRVH